VQPFSLLIQKGCDSPLQFNHPGENPTVTCTWKKTPPFSTMQLQIIYWNPKVVSVTASCHFTSDISRGEKASKLTYISGDVSNVSIHDDTAAFNVLNRKYSIWSLPTIKFDINSNEGVSSYFEAANYNNNDRITCTFNLMGE
jgi:hypothetical protein